MNRYSILSAPARVIVADPPWKFGDSLPGETRGASKQYATLDVRDIIRFPLPPIADNAILFLWRVSSMQEEALRVVDAWGFTLKTEIVWIKRTSAAPEAKLAFGMGHYTRGSHETCLVATRGRFKVADRAVRSIFDTLELDAPLGEHSQKPDAFYALVERLGFGDAGIPDLAQGPVELFGRAPRAGWHVFGNEVGGSQTAYVGPLARAPAGVTQPLVASVDQGGAVEVTSGSSVSAEAQVAEAAAAFDKVKAAQENADRVMGALAALDEETEPAASDPLDGAVVRERIILHALTVNLVTADEVRRGTNAVWPLVVERAAMAGLVLSEHGIASAPAPVSPVETAPAPVAPPGMENVGSLVNALALKLSSVPWTLPEVAAWPVAAREQARQWLLGLGPAPEEIKARTKANAEAARAAPAEEGAKKRGRPKKAKPCVVCEAPAADGKLCADCKAKLGVEDEPAAETAPAAPADPYEAVDPTAEDLKRMATQHTGAWGAAARVLHVRDAWAEAAARMVRDE